MREKLAPLIFAHFYCAKIKCNKFFEPKKLFLYLKSDEKKQKTIIYFKMYIIYIKTNHGMLPRVPFLKFIFSKQ